MGVSDARQDNVLERTSCERVQENLTGESGALHGREITTWGAISPNLPYISIVAIRYLTQPQLIDPLIILITDYRTP